LKHFENKGINIGLTNGKIHVSLNETTTMADVEELLDVFSSIKGKKVTPNFEGTY